MSFGRPTTEQWLEIERHVDGHVVHDLGAGDLHLGHQLLSRGATRIVAVDRYAMPRKYGIEWSVECCYFHDYHAPIATAFISWPVNWYSGLDRLVARAKTVLYLGSNLDGHACGDPGFWNVLREREILAHVPAPENTLIVYGPASVQRELVPEELAGLNRYGTIVPFAEAYPGSVSRAST